MHPREAGRSQSQPESSRNEREGDQWRATGSKTLHERACAFEVFAHIIHRLFLLPSPNAPAAPLAAFWTSSASRPAAAWMRSISCRMGLYSSEN
jgi:hypothetical protein